jgi:hypothetical protein
MTTAPASPHQVVLARMQAHAAAVKAALGAVPHPAARLLAVHGINFAPGQQVRDTVTGQLGVIRGGGQVLYQRQNPGT